MPLFTQNAKVDALKRAPLFSGLARRDLLALAKVSEDVEVPAGRVLCREGEVGREFFVIVDGEVDIIRKRRKVTTRRGPDFVGEIALLEQTPRMATVKTKTPVRMFVLSDRDFRRLVKENPGIENKVLRALARRVVELSSDPTLA